MDTVIEAVADNCHRLTSVDLSLAEGVITEKGVDSLLNKSPELRNLYLGACRHINKIGDSELLPDPLGRQFG